MVAQHFKAHCWQSLCLEEQTGAQVAELILTEQFIQVLPLRGRKWLLRRCPGSLSGAVQLMENCIEDEESLDTELPVIWMKERQDTDTKSLHFILEGPHLEAWSL